RQIENALHQSSRMIVNLCLTYRIDTVVIGKNDLWKQNVTLGSVVNQQFTAIPHARLIEMLTYKCQSVGIKVVTIEESYTSKCSFLDGEAVEKQASYAGKRIHRGLFRTGRGLLLNADVNAALNLITKAFPDAFGPGPDAGGHGMADWVVNPVRVTPFGSAGSGTSKREATCEHQLYGSVSQARPSVPIPGLGTKVCQI
ncbi:MAG: IS200/IS605 family element transposase accessory protein TnpB, partial [Acidobacteria bacterium]|nr:IS200/IS605 family element transposase accessory protein TnpB [Acidobacteriota bacterium]